jgi:hypothetical protein
MFTKAKIILLTLCVTGSIVGTTVYGLSAPQKMGVDSLLLTLGADWRVEQQAQDQDLKILGFRNQNRYVSFFVSPTFRNLREWVGAEATVIQTQFASFNQVPWELIEVSYKGKRTLLFSSELKGIQYFGYSHDANSERAQKNVELFLKGISLRTASLESLTGPDFTGKKYYVGFGDHLSGFMGNEVKYDIAHTHDIFTHEIGGGYIGSKINGSGMGFKQLNEKWKDLKSVMTEKDMYVQYSSGHGSFTGLAFGPSYNQIRDNALSYPAKEIIIFTMSCYSGNLVDSFDKKKDVWQNWQNEGRTLLVMSSSRAGETSSTGPITDPEEPNGPSGSAGSAFGHALWKALIGHADGEIDGVKDNYLSLAEIREYTKKKTEDVGGHTPVTTGSYNEELIMVKVPPKEFLESLEGGTDGLSDSEIMERVQLLNDEWRLR